MAGSPQFWTKASISLATFGFINMILFIAFSSPFTQITDMILSIATDLGIAGNVTPFILMLRNIFGIIFVLSMVGLIVWFILGAHEEEHMQYPKGGPGSGWR